MSHRADRITDAVRSYDRELYAKDDGKAIRIYRKQKEYSGVQVTPDFKIWQLKRNDHLVMSLTDTWGVRGNRVDWGIEPIMARLKALDLWNDDNLSNQFFKDEEKDEKSRERKRRHDIESFLYDFKSAFAESTNDINTSTLSKNIYRR